MTELEKECYSKAVNTIIDKMAGKAEADSEKFSIGVVGDAVSVFKMGGTIYRDRKERSYL